MDITPIYDLRGRLRAAFIAGTNLLAEDFRLKRAVEAFAPLEKAAPVFARVGELSRMLIEPGEAGAEGKEGILLDAITLVDAVCCTQGAVGVSGNLLPYSRRIRILWREAFRRQFCPMCPTPHCARCRRR